VRVEAEHVGADGAAGRERQGAGEERARKEGSRAGGISGGVRGGAYEPAELSVLVAVAAQGRKGKQAFSRSRRAIFQIK